MASSSRPAPRRRVVLGLAGPTLDGGRDAQRWQHWRPTVAVVQHEELLVDRFELLYERRSTTLAETLCRDIASVSPETAVRLHPIELADAWDFEEVYGVLQEFAHAYAFDPEAEDYLLHITTGTHVWQICTFLLAEARYLPARLLQTSPPRRTAGGPGSYRIIDLDLSRYDRIAQRFESERSASLSMLKVGIDTRNAAYNRLIDQIERVAARSRAPILLTGPTGAGKSRLARRIYELKRERRLLAGRFVEVNCATLRGEGAMSALFGHRRGAFTGAQTDRPGLLRAADGGLLFLDEIAELGADEQAMLLRAVEERRFLPLGADAEAESDFQLIAGTNRDLAEQVRSGRFRDDLLARIDLWTFRLPGLAERREDIEPNLGFELDQASARGGTRVTLNKEARERFLAFATSPAAAWTGNFRDLNAAVTRMATLAQGGRITVDLVDDETARLAAGWEDAAPPPPGESLLARLLGSDRLAALDLFDRVQLAEVVRVCVRSRSLAEAGRTLFAASRQKKKQPNDADRLRKYLARFGLAWAELHAG
jgi:transcriptional regulatory protein RtcR